jgi:hypothetical protein
MFLDEDVPLGVAFPWPAFAVLPDGGTLTLPRQPLHLIRVPVGTFEIVVVGPSTSIVRTGVVRTFTTTLFVAPQPAAATATLIKRMTAGSRIRSAERSSDASIRP